MLNNRGMRGDHYVTLVVQIPTALKKNQKAALEEYAKACGEDVTKA
ncbi:MAG: hypothetical protein Q4C63_07450 [Eubacteriales bacterium]|nr:hypothetical protein [Eubacteriales bacterium]